MTRLDLQRMWILFIIPVFCLMGCSDGDVQKAPGTYTITVVDPDGKSTIGTARVSGSGDLYVVAIVSALLDVAFSGTLVVNTLTATFTDADSKTNTVTIQFTWDRDRFTGSIQRGDGLYTFEAVRTGPLGVGWG